MPKETSHTQRPQAPARTADEPPPREPQAHPAPAEPSTAGLGRPNTPEDAAVAVEPGIPAWRKRLITTVHDLKTPVTISLLNLELAEMEHDLSEVFRYTAAARRELEFMLDTVSNLLDLEHSTSGRLEMQLAPLDLGPIIASAVERMSVLLRDKPELRIENRISTPLPTLLGDANKLARVFSNLISNSINHTERGSIRIGANVDLHSRRLTVSVADTGLGIRDEILRSVFKLFHSDGLGTRSTGIGLTYVRHVIEGHGGSVWVESTPGVGTIVHLKLHFSPAEPAAPAAR